MSEEQINSESDPRSPSWEDQPLPFPEPAVDAEPKAPSSEHLEARRAELQAANIGLLNGLAQQGMETDPPLLIMQMKLRLDLLTELLLRSGTDTRAAYEATYEYQLNQLLEQVVRDSARAKLLAK